MTLPIAEHAFWKERLDAALARGQLHESIYVVSPSEWSHIQEAHRVVLRDLLQPGQRVLDGGCGYGALVDVLPEGLDYTGVDFMPEFVDLAKILHPGRAFLLGDLRNLPFPDNHFDVAICRSMEGMVVGNLGDAAWKAMECELLRVAPTLLLLSYSAPEAAVIHGVPLSDAISRTAFPIGYD